MNCHGKIKILKVSKGVLEKARSELEFWKLTLQRQNFRKFVDPPR